ncbi:hypothetical protein PsYK624_151370 [Phanerochaete sordida]|uniref:Uncharacterized protein n=1 Tax=Phanerochaete sordida TaxID=48140 RepID=A0A9P3GPQ0_9APHY|nr:hypothetical protein PsYK624_151370 [Phanerochaete sordida]
MNAKENSGEGGKWTAWINRSSQGFLADDTPLRVVLQNPNPSGLCKSWYKADTTVCPPAAMPNSPGVANDAVRQE